MHRIPRHRSSRIVVLVVALLGGATALRAQQHATPGNGVELGVGVGTASGFSTFNDPYTLHDHTYTASDKELGLHLGLALPDLFTRGVGLSVRGAFATTSTRHYYVAPAIPVLLQTDTGLAVLLQTTDLELAHSNWRVEAEALVRIAPVGGLALLAGPAIGTRQVTSWSYSSHLLSPDGARFLNPASLSVVTADKGRTLIYGSGSVLPGENHFTVAALGGVCYTFPISRDVSIAPELWLRYDFTSPGLIGVWNPLTLQAAVNLSLGNLMRLRAQGNAPPPEPSAPSEARAPTEAPARAMDTSRRDIPPPAQRPIAAAIDLYSIDPDGSRRQTATLHPSITARSRSIELPRTIPFEPNRITPPSMAVEPPGSLDSVALLDPERAVDHLLDVLAARLNAHPTVTITLAGSTAPGEPASIGKCRAEEVRGLLIGSFGCRSSQILLGPATRSPAGAAVTIGGTKVEELTRVERRWVERSTGASPIGVEPSIDLPAGLRSWAIEFRQGSETIARRTSEDTSQTLDLGLILRDRAIGDSLPPLVAVLTVEDADGIRHSARDEMPFVAGRTPRDTAHIASYILIPGATAQATVDEQLLPSLWRIALEARRGGRVSVRPLRETTDGARSATLCVRHLRELLGAQWRVEIAPAPAATAEANGADSPFNGLIDAGVEIMVEESPGS